MLTIYFTVALVTQSSSFAPVVGIAAKCTPLPVAPDHSHTGGGVTYLSLVDMWAFSLLCLVRSLKMTAYSHLSIS